MSPLGPDQNINSFDVERPQTFLQQYLAQKSGRSGDEKGLALVKTLDGGERFQRRHILGKSAFSVSKWLFMMMHSKNNCALFVWDTLCIFCEGC